MALFGKKIQNYVQKMFMTTSIHVLCLNFKSSAGEWVKPYVVLLTEKKFAKYGFFSAPLCARSAEGAKNVQESVPRDPMSPCKISPQSVQFVGVIPENVIVHKYSICLRDIIIVGC